MVENADGVEGKAGGIEGGGAERREGGGAERRGETGAESAAERILNRGA